MDLDVTKSKFFQFNVTIDGIDYSTLNGKLEFMYENIIYGFPAKVYRDRVEVEIPPLQSIIKKHILESDKMTGKLDITGEGFHTIAWDSEMNLSRSLFIESDNPVVEDSVNNYHLDEDPKSIYEGNDNILEEDVDFLKQLQSDVEKDFSVMNNLTETKSPKRKKKKKSITESTIKKSSFNKKAFIKKITETEKHAVLNDIPLSETSKKDNSEQKELRMKVRNIIQENYIKNLKRINKSKAITEASQSPIVVEQEKIVKTKFDPNLINESNISKKSVSMLMESVGMTTEKTQRKMIEHAKDKGAKTDIEIFDSIKGLIIPEHKNNGLQENYSQQLEFFANRDEK